MQPQHPQPAAPEAALDTQTPVGAARLHTSAAPLQFYEQKIVPSSREPESVRRLRGGDHWEAERWFEKLPLFLREEPKRLKVVKALRDALEMF
jgi:hypothetical protein